MTNDFPIPGYSIRRGSTLERSQLVKFIQRTYQELFPQEKDFGHLATTVDQYLSKETPLWWVDDCRDELGQKIFTPPPIACLWMGNVIDQVKGDRHAHIFLLYVTPEHRRQGIATALMQHAENWAKQRGDRQIGLQVFQSNQTALNLYHQLGYQTQSLWMVKTISQ